MPPITTGTRRIPKWKLELAEEIAGLAKKHSAFLVVDLTGIPARHIQMLRKRLSNRAVIRVVKPKVTLKALESLELPVDLLRPHMTGQVALIFADLNVFELTNIVENFTTMDYYGPGEIVDKEIVIPEGNTGLPAGPILSTFGRLKIPTKVVGNVIHVAKDTVVAKPGDIVSPDLSALLQKLGLALKEIRVRVKCGVDSGIVISSDRLRLDIPGYEDMFKKAVLDAFKLSIELVVPEPHVLRVVIARAHQQSLTLVTETGFLTPETAEYVFRAAHAKAVALATEISRYIPELGLGPGRAVETKTTEKPRVEEKKEEKEEKEISEEALAEGFAALFG